MAVRSGLKTLVELAKALSALDSQLLNLPRCQEIEQYGIMVPRIAAAPGLSDADINDIHQESLSRRKGQSENVHEAIKVVRELMKEYECSVSISAFNPPEDKDG